MPDFRFNALEDKFCLTMTRLLTILTDFGKLREEFNMKRMLELTRVEEWPHSVPMTFYMTPLM